MNRSQRGKPDGRDSGQTQEPAEKKRKIGEGHLAGMLRLGMKEIARVLPPFPDSIQPIEEPGVMGNPTNLEVHKERGADARGSVHGNERQSPLREAREANDCGHGKEGRDKGRER